MKKWISPIERNFHFIWIGDKEKPDFFKLFLDGFKKKCPEFKIKVWSNKDLTKKNFPKTYSYIQKVKSMHGKKIRSDSLDLTDYNTKGEPRYYNKWAQITDLMRLEIVYNRGGYYFDTTFECLKPLFDLFNIPKKKFIGCNESPKDSSYLSNAFFGAKKGSIILKRLLSKKSLDNIDYSWWKVNQTTGPYYLRSGIRSKDNYHLFPSNYFYPFVEFETKGRTISKNKCHFQTKKQAISQNKRKTKRNKKRSKSRSKSRRSKSIQSKTISKIYKLKNKKGYLCYPCNQYPESFAVKHWTLGKTWIK